MGKPIEKTYWIVEHVDGKPSWESYPRGKLLARVLNVNKQDTRVELLSDPNEIKHLEILKLLPYKDRSKDFSCQFVLEIPKHSNWD